MKLSAPHLTAILCTLLPAALHAQPAPAANAPSPPERPNIIVIMSDDIGISDIGCYGSEIETPALDHLAANGVRFTQFYNMARCCPSRAALLTGLAPHQAGVGHMLNGWPGSHPGYSDRLSTDSVTFGEVLGASGYRTYMVGKWHVAKGMSPNGPKDAWPLQRGFDKYYGIITGAGSLYDPATLCRGNNFITIENDPEYKPENYYFTDALGDNALKFIDEHDRESPEKPFLMYLAFTAAHWPMHAPADEVAHQRGRYDAGYEAIRHARYNKMVDLGIIDPAHTSSPAAMSWDAVPHKEWEARNMEVYAAMIHRMDKNINKLVAKLRATNRLDNTIIMYMQDNGGCAEGIGREPRDSYPDNLNPLAPDELQSKIWPPMQTRDGRPLKTGPEIMAGPDDSYIAYGEGWANVSNTPFRQYKHWVHEGGIATPLIVHWPRGIPDTNNNALIREPSSLIDIMATAIDAARTTYPATFNNHPIKPLGGVSLLPLLQDRPFDRGGPLFWEHESNRAVRDGKWKIVTSGPGPWELYDMDNDRAEMHNLAHKHPDIVQKMAAQWQQWAEENDVLPVGTWETIEREDHQRRTNAADEENDQFTLNPGDILDGPQRPSIAHRGLRIRAEIDQWGDQGVIISQGGGRHGYTLFSEDGIPHFILRSDHDIIQVTSSITPATSQPVTLQAAVRRNGNILLRVNGEIAGETTGPGLLKVVPAEGLTIGNDRDGSVGEYPANFRFTGKINQVTLRLAGKRPAPNQ